MEEEQRWECRRRREDADSVVAEHEEHHDIEQQRVPGSDEGEGGGEARVVPDALPRHARPRVPPPLRLHPHRRRHAGGGQQLLHLRLFGKTAGTKVSWQGDG